MPISRPHIRFQSKRVQYSSGTMLYDRAHPASSLMFVESGFVKVGAAGNVVFDYLGPGDVCGECCLQAETGDQFARALTDVCVAAIPRARTPSVVCRDPHFATRVVNTLLRRLSRYESSIADLVTEPTGRRVAKLLLRFASVGRHGWVELPNLTNPEIASSTGTTRWQVSRFVNEFQKLGIVRRQPGFWVDFDRLRAFLGGEPGPDGPATGRPASAPSRLPRARSAPAPAG